MRAKLPVLFCSLLVSTVLFAQQATVTIYTPSGGKANLKSTSTLGVIPGDYPFMGAIYDGDAKLGNFSAGRFMTFHVTPGKHVFAASDHFNKNTPKAEVTLDAKAGEAYIVRAAMTHKGVWAIQSFHYSLETIPCAQARAEADTLKPISIKKVDKGERNNLIGSAYFPSCPDLASK